MDLGDIGKMLDNTPMDKVGDVVEFVLEHRDELDKIIGVVKAAPAMITKIADSLGDSRAGDQESGLFFTGRNGWRLNELVPVRDLVGEITEDYGLDRLAGH